jgi:hypothetical protein
MKDYKGNMRGSIRARRLKIRMRSPNKINKEKALKKN